jgi:hypothetical protein
LIQLAVAYRDLDPDPNDPLSFLQTDETSRRIRALLGLVNRQRLALSTAYRNTIFSLWPLLDSVFLIHMLRPKWQYLLNDEIDSFVLIMIQSILWFSVNLESAAATIAATIKACLGDRRFPLANFIDCLYAHSDSIEKFSYLFVELQFQDVFSYLAFLMFIHRRGLLNTQPNTTLALLLALPSLDRSSHSLSRLCRAIHRLGGISDYDDLVLRVGELPVTAFCGLPPLYRFSVGQWIIDHTQNFSEGVSDLIALDLFALLPSLFLKLRPRSFSVRDARALEAIAPVLIARNLFQAVA